MTNKILLHQGIIVNDEIKNDALLEVTNIGAGQAATALSQILMQKVFITVPSLRFVPIEDVPESLGGSESHIIGMYFTISGDLSGRIMLVFDKKSGHHLAALLTSDPKNEKGKLGEIDKSAMMEMGNIIANSYLNGLAGLLDIKLYPSVPFFAEDALGAVVDSLLIEIAMVAEKALLIDTEMSIEQENLKGSFLVFPDTEFMKKIFELLDLRR
jgi:chemotaxis protein CheC